MIPKVIHYCWFGYNPKSKLTLDCINSWKKFCPDFEIIEWNEENSKTYSNKFYKDSLRKKKYAFVADYIRAKVLFEHGGIYMDTDMLLLKPINQLLYYDFFIGHEVEGRVAFGMFGASEKHRFLKQMLDYYNQTEFNVFSPPIITHTFSPIINEKTVIENEMIFPTDRFYALAYENKDNDFSLYIGENSIAVHLWDHSLKMKQEDTISQWIKNCFTVLVDFLLFGYSYPYFRRYFKEFSRKIYHVLKSRL